MVVAIEGEEEEDMEVEAMEEEEDMEVEDMEVEGMEVEAMEGEEEMEAEDILGAEDITPEVGEATTITIPTTVVSASPILGSQEVSEAATPAQVFVAAASLPYPSSFSWSP